METGLAHWTDLDGYAAAHGMGYLQDMPLSRFVHFVWYFVTKGGEPDEVEKLRARLWQPPIGEVVDDARSPWSPANENASFAAFKSGIAS